MGAEASGHAHSSSLGQNRPILLDHAEMRPTDFDTNGATAQRASSTLGLLLARCASPRRLVPGGPGESQHSKYGFPNTCSQKTLAGIGGVTRGKWVRSSPSVQQNCKTEAKSESTKSIPKRRLPHDVSACISLIYSSSLPVDGNTITRAM